MATIPVHIKDNESTIKARPKEDNKSVKMRSDCDIKAKNLEALIISEAQTRADADRLLQSQININKDAIEELKEKTTEVDGTTIVLNDESKVSLNPTLNGGYLVVDTITARNNIDKALLKRGTIAKVYETGTVYEWDGVNWLNAYVNIKSIGEGLKLNEAGELSVDTTDEAEEFNRQPITSNGVYNILGDINERLIKI